MHTSNYEASNSMNISVGNTSEVGLYTLKSFKAIVNLSVRTNIVQKNEIHPNNRYEYCTMYLQLLFVF